MIDSDDLQKKEEGREGQIMAQRSSEKTAHKSSARKPGQNIFRPESRERLAAYSQSKREVEKRSPAQTAK
mgnify:CR=1 FL=1